MAYSGAGPARAWVRLCSAIVFGLLCAAAALIALDPPPLAGATALSPAVTPQTVAADYGAIQGTGLVTATHIAISATGPIHYGTGPVFPEGSSMHGPASSSVLTTAAPGGLAPQSGDVKYDNLGTSTGFFVPGSPATATGL